MATTFSADLPTRLRKRATDQVRIVERENGQKYTTHMRNAFERRQWHAVVDEQGRLDHTAELLHVEGIDTPRAPDSSSCVAATPTSHPWTE